MLIKYRFSINGHPVSPIYKDDLAKEYALEPQQRFYRAELSGALKFMKDDFDWIMSQPFDTEYVVLLEKSNDGGLTWTNYYTGVFFQADCTIDLDMKKIEVKLSTKDQYNEVLAGLEKEYDLLKLAPAKTPLTIQKRPLIQLYIPGDSVVSCFLGGDYWEQDVYDPVTDTNALVNTYHFALASTLYKWNLSGGGTVNGVQDLLVGDYVKESATYFYGRNNTYQIREQNGYVRYYLIYNASLPLDSDDEGAIYSDGNGNKWVVTYVPGSNISIIAYGHTNALPSSGTMTWVSGGVYQSNFTYTTHANNSGTYYYTSVIRVSDSLEVFRSHVYSSASVRTGGETIKLFPYNDISSGNLEGYYFDPIKVYMRYLLDVETISGLNTYAIPSNDIVEDNRNYKRVIGYAIDCATIYNYASLTPTKYGRAEDGRYWQMPSTLWGTKFYPIARSTWGLSSIWFAFDTFDWNSEEQGRKSYTMNDSMMISEAIRVLLNIIDPTITHDGTPDYSQFLYGTTNPITYNAFRVMITQKSNILAGEYDRPAQKAPVTLSAILAMLRDTMQLYWYIEDNKFKIEHVSWFKNGGAYSGTPVTSFDLTTLIQQKNKKPWGFISSKYSYDKVDMAERYEFSWMDDVTEGFAGYPIEINSRYVQRGKIENVNISAFTSDIDYMLLNPGAISQDGFALFGAVWSSANNRYELPYIERTIDGAELRLQNGLMSFIYLHPNFWTYDLPSTDVTINEDPYSWVQGVERKKKQKVSFPSLDDPNPLQLIKTYLGDGQIEKLSINLQSRMNDIELKYDTE